MSYEAWRISYQSSEQAALAAYKIAARNQRDAERYRWLREHFRFANDSMRELWFDPALEPNDSSVPVDLDAEIDRAMSGANDELSRPAAGDHKPRRDREAGSA